MNLNLNVTRLTRSQRRAVWRAAYATMTSQLSLLREASTDGRYPAVADFDNVQMALAQLRTIAAAAQAASEPMAQADAPLAEGDALP